MARILAFDSGIGGLGVVAQLRALLPGVPIDYLADTAVYPYGEQPDALLRHRIVTLLGQAIARLRPSVVVIACNTASTLALDSLRATYGIPFVGCVPPIKWAADHTRTGTIGLLATRATVRRPYLQDLHARFAPRCTLLAHGARGLADMAERAFRGLPPDRTQLAIELDGLFGQPGGAAIDVVGIGCTHYTFLLDALRESGPAGVTWLDPAPAVARQAARVLTEQAPAIPCATGGERVCFTALPPDFPALLPGLGRLGYGADALSVFTAGENTAAHPIGN
ncbi:Glutamate racemase [Gluconacetobacter sp. SXCC-1]|uniref:Glutamate racemase n=1 Tax=Komagataeibacter rhaeticus TaxID=215221 RepID=A0A181CBF3_9PROT|nr:aspartate/glutamate racemase family protein [Komagataeibacter rhaeticus]ATU72481.1 glutamate racemase [Komagataeibacter xylinus]EGG74816.1 Glutamate racemase [Gluconacetobacter sp. SXCC-1]QIP35606.1 glutamate racemase [Komagataeibacter rhaeticus]QOC45363.1 aspartate/glutamate racemase family protein [Komagataeibacter rhaeticus]WPP22230.1 aspartate/glutamate racemase family protein [Komagataeibacter rhaeticus]